MSLKFLAVRDEQGDEVQALIDALPGPAALVAADGAIVAVNGAWRDRLGAGRRLPRPAGALFAAFLQARRDGHGEGVLGHGGAGHRARVSIAGPHRFLVRLDPLSAPIDAASAKGGEPPRAGGLDPFAAASPFG